MLTAEYIDFSTAWEQRLLAVADEHIDAEISFVEGSRVATFESGETLSVKVKQLAENPPNRGWWDCEITVEYSFKNTSDPQASSDTWKQIEEAFGDGYLGADPLYLRLSQGDLQTPESPTCISYLGNDATDDDTRTLTFEAILGIEN